MAWVPGRWPKEAHPYLQEEMEWNSEFLVMEDLFEDPEFNPEQTFLLGNPSSPANITLTCHGKLTSPWLSAMWFRYN